MSIADRNSRLKQAKLDAATAIAQFRELKERKFSAAESLAVRPSESSERRIGGSRVGWPCCAACASCGLPSPVVGGVVGLRSADFFVVADLFSASQSGPDAQMAKDLEKQTQAELEQMNEAFLKNKDKVIELLLATTTTVTIDVADNLKLKHDKA